MKKIIIISIALLLTFALYAQTQKTVYRYVVKFNSECCGVPDAAPLLTNITKFKKKHHIKKLSYYKFSPIGREGEYYMAFQLKELTEKKQHLFIKEINATVIKMKDKGSASTKEHMVIDKQSLSGRTTITKATL